MTENAMIGAGQLILRVDPRSMTRPPESHNILVVTTLRDIATTSISKHEGDAMIGVHLENMEHPLSATRATWILNVLYPRGPAGEFVAEFTIGDRFGQIVVPNPLEHQAQLGALKFYGAVLGAMGELQAKFLVFGRLGEVDEPGPASDPFCRKVSVPIWSAAFQSRLVWMHDPDTAEIITEWFPATDSLAFATATIEQLQ